MVSNWHRGPSRRPTSGRKIQNDAYPDYEFAVKTIIPFIEDGEAAADVVSRVFGIGHNNQFSINIFKDQRVVKAMMRRALKFNIRLSSYYKKAREEQLKGRL